MSFLPQPAQTEGSAGDVPDVVSNPVNGTETFLKGTVLQLSSGNFTEAGAGTNTNLHSMALEGAADGESDGPADELVAARINEQTHFYFPVEDGGSIHTDIGSLSLTVGDQGDLSVVSDVYAFDNNSSASAALEILEIFTDRNLVLVEFIPTTIA